MENLKLITEGLGELNMNLLTSSEIDDMNDRLRQGHTMEIANEDIVTAEAESIEENFS